jgi:isopentenyl-diphosphate delta-isomerase
MTAVSRESLIVELVDEAGTPVGSATVDEAHRAPGRLHRAFSVFLRDPAGRVLLQQRAAVKTRFPLRWANTCCGHPSPGEPVTVAGARRLVEEIGVAGAELTEVGVYAYYAEDPSTGRVEYEFDHVLVGDLPVGGEVRPDPDEVADTRWVSVRELQEAIAAEPRLYAPWLAGVTERLAEHVTPAGRDAARVTPAGGDAARLTPAGDAAHVTPAAVDAARLTPAGGNTARLTPAGGSAARLTPAGGDTRSLAPAGGDAARLTPAAGHSGATGGHPAMTAESPVAASSDDPKRSSGGR